MTPEGAGPPAVLGRRRARVDVPDGARPNSTATAGDHPKTGGAGLRVVFLVCVDFGRSGWYIVGVAATRKVSWSIEVEVAEEVERRAVAERRSVSGMASLLLERGLDDGAGGVEGTRVEADAQPRDVAARTVATGQEVGLTAPSSSVWGRFEQDAPRPGACERAAYHRRGEFCKSCGKMQ